VVEKGKVEAIQHRRNPAKFWHGAHPFCAALAKLSGRHRLFMFLTAEKARKALQRRRKGALRRVGDSVHQDRSKLPAVRDRNGRCPSPDSYAGAAKLPIPSGGAGIPER
jgi:hypothetical protein